MGRRTIDFGIDLGTTNSEIACMHNGEVRVLKNNYEEEFTPSVVRLTDKGEVIVGRKAYERHVSDPENTFIEFKRWMGTHQTGQSKASGRSLTPEQMSAEVLKNLRATARNSYDEDVIAAVITVPCNFEDIQCEATKRAAKLAGIQYSPLLQEPVAASIAYGFLEKMPKGYWAVYDLGGGTFDIAIMSAKDGRLTVVDHCGDNYLGGKDFDWRVVERFIHPILSKEYNLPGLNRTDGNYKSLNAILKAESEKAKIELSSSEVADITIFTGGARVSDKDGKVIDITIPISRKQYEGLIDDYVVKTVDLFKEALKKQQLSSADIANILLVGGPTKTPFIRQRLKDALGIPVEVRINPLTVVAQGAAIYAASQMLPNELVVRDKSKVALKLSFSPMTVEQDTLVAGKIENAQTGWQVQIRRIDGHWQSGLVGLQNGAFAINVPLSERKLNSFEVSMVDSNGNSIPCDPSAFTITQGISVGEAPLTRSIGLELEDGSFDKILERGVVLPARSKMKTYKASKTIRPNEQGDLIKIIVREGESEFAKRNRYVGELIINGSMIMRTVPENEKIDIILSVDKDRKVKASAYIECVDKNFDDIIVNKVSPKPDAQKLSNEFKQENVRYDEIKGKIQGSSNSDLVERLKDEHITSKIQELQSDIQAAKGGDPDAAEKADRRLKDLQITLDSLEVMTRWPALIQLYNEVVAVVKELVDSYGKEQEKEHFEALKNECNKAVEAKDVKKLEHSIDEMKTLRWQILFAQPGFWVGAFQEVKSGNVVYSDPDKAKSLMSEGGIALQRQDIESLKSIMWQLWGLMPSEAQEDIQNKVSDAGIRRL